MEALDDGLTFRQLAKGNARDLALMEAFFDQMGSETRAFFNHGDGNRRAMRESLNGPDEEKTIHWIAEADGRVAGYVFIIRTQTGIPWLGIAVAEDMKGRHLGRKLIALAQNYCYEHGKGGLLLMTHPANVRGQRLYESCGFKRLGVHSCGEFLYCWTTITA